MVIQHKNNVSHKRSIQGSGLINSVINKLPLELHLPGYQFCGPGTKLEKRIRRGDIGKNLLDAACKEHDIAYLNHQSIDDRHTADKILAEKAWQRVKSKDSSLGERASALLVTNMMKSKIKLGLGLSIKKKKTTNKNDSTTRSIIRRAKNKLKLSRKANTVKDSIKVALQATKKIFKKNDGIPKTDRIIPIPKIGGVLPLLLPLFAGLSAAGALAGGTANIVKAVNAASNATKQLKEAQRHNQTMESIALGKGMFLRPYKKGFGIYLQPESKNY